MNFIQLHVLCNKDTRTEEDIKTEELFASLEIPVKAPTSEKVIQEWRVSLINISLIAGMYSHANTENTIIHLTGAGVVTVKESYEEILGILRSMKDPAPPPSNVLSYTLTP
jgi:hypothetical protein